MYRQVGNSVAVPMIKEVATRRDRQRSNDPMANYIQTLLDNKDESDSSVERNHRFSGNHFDEHIGGWVSDHWGSK